jgi:cytochrome P450
MTASAQWNVDKRQFWVHGTQPEHPVDFEPKTGLWRVFGYQEAVQVFGDFKTFSSDTLKLSPVEIPFSDGNLVEMDPPEHGRLRKVVNRAFTPSMVAGLEDRIRELTNELLDAAAAKDEVELIEDLAYPLPVTVITEMLGVPSSDQHLFKQWVDGMMDQTEELSFSEPTEEQAVSMQHAMDHMQQLIAYMSSHAAERRRSPRNDLLTHLVEAEVDGARLSDEAVAVFANSLLVNGHLTTTMVLGNTVLCLDAFPEARAAVQADRSLAPAAIEEALRYLTPAPVLGRATTCETELGGRTIPESQMVQVWVGAANRDARQFEEPDRYDIHRSPNQHLTFGHGIHFCIGAPLARLESRVVIETLHDRFPDMRTDPGDPPEFQPNPYVTAVRRLPVVLT